MSLLSALDFRGNRVIQFDAVTTPTLKGGNPWGKATVHSLRKVATVSAMIGGQGLYGVLVNAARMILGTPVNPDGTVADFAPLPRKWGEYVARPAGTQQFVGESFPYVAHKGSLYLPMSIIASLRHEYRLDNGAAVAKDAVAEWLPERKEGQRQSLPIDRIIRWRCYGFESVANLRIGTAVTEGLAARVMERLLAGDDAGAEGAAGIIG